MRKLAAIAILAITWGCATGPTSRSAASGCDAASAQSLVGQSASSKVADQAQRISGAGMVRWLLPGQVITMEFRADRLNLVLDGQNRIQAIRCG